MTDDEVLVHTKLLIPTFFPEGLKVTQEQTFEDLKNELTRALTYLIDYDFKRLIQIMYKIYVDERLFREALKNENVAERLTDLTINRLQKRAEIRLKYRSKDSL